MAKQTEAPEGAGGDAQVRPPEPSDGKATVEELRAAEFPDGRGGHPHRDGWKHDAASALHGWTLHEHQTGKPMRLSLDDYREALKAALRPVAKGESAGKYVPHGPALSSAHGGK